VNRITGWDARVGLRAALLALLALVVAWLVTASTDEGGVLWAVRVARTLPLAPACAAIGTWLALVRARARGETLALESVGRTPLANAGAAVTGGAFIAMLAAGAIALSDRVDVGGFYPTLPVFDEAQFTPSGFVDAARAVRIERDGAMVPVDTPAPETAAKGPDGIPTHGRAAAALATAVAGVALPLVIGQARRRSLGRVGLAVGATVVASIVLFHAAAAGRAPVFTATTPPFILLAVTAWRYLGPPWQTDRR
jgi:hypothetical protein